MTTMMMMIIILISMGWISSDSNDDRMIMHAGLDEGAKGVFKQLRDDVFEVDRHEGECRFGLTVDDHRRPHAVFEIADRPDEGCAAVDYVGWFEPRVDDANVAAC